MRVDYSLIPYMYYPLFYKDLNEEKIETEIAMEGFKPKIISDEPNFVYKGHHHPEIKLLVFLNGEMKVKINEKKFDCKPGDKLIIPGNTKHSAIVGPLGCRFFWSEKL